MATIKQTIKKRAKDFTLSSLIPLLYKICARKPVNPKKVVFYETMREGLDPSFQLVFDRVKDSGQFDVSLVRQKMDSSVVAQFRELAQASVIFIRMEAPVIDSLPLRPETRVIQLWHACGAFKRFGFSTADLGFGPSLKERQKHPFHQHYSLVTVSSEDVVWAYEDAMNLKDKPGVVQALGVSRTDIFYDQEHLQAAVDKLHEDIPATANRKVILYAPTFRGESKQATAPDALDIPKLKAALGDDYVLVIKHHPYALELPPIPKDCEDFAYMAPNLSSVNELIMASDVCITDYSSLVFEWSLMRRPIAFFAYDLDDYLDERGFYYDYESMTPGPICKTTDELATWVRSLDGGFDTTEIDAFRERFMGACDGHATERIIQAVFGDGDAS